MGIILSFRYIDLSPWALLGTVPERGSDKPGLTSPLPRRSEELVLTMSRTHTAIPLCLCICLTKTGLKENKEVSKQVSPQVSRSSQKDQQMGATDQSQWKLTS